MQRRNSWSREITTGVPTEATITVKDHGTDTLSTLYSDDGVTPLANPFTSAADTGIYGWYAANGRYDETVTPTDTEFTAYTNPDILLYDPADAP